MQDLSTFVQVTSQAGATPDLMEKLHCVFPVFGKALLSLSGEHKPLRDKWLREVASWFVDQRTQIENAASSFVPDEISRDLSDDWEQVRLNLTLMSLVFLFVCSQTGNRYFLPPVRKRPAYPNIKESAFSVKTANAGCTNNYADYKQRRLTGGCQVICCPHRYFYGFHFFKGFEGRNDVFSAIYTR
jgi:hypothetical protein